jgi:hypothetical protein
MHSLLDPGKEAASHERAIGSLRDRAGALLVEFRRLFAPELSRLELRAKVRPYLSVVTVSNVRAILRRKGAVAKERFVDELERLWRQRPRAPYRGLARASSGESMKLLSSAIDYLAPKFTNATRMFKEQLAAEGVSVWVSSGCIEELARIASAAAARTRQADEPYKSCLRREIVTRARFIRQWTSSDESFDQTQWGELISVARKYALPRSWRLIESVASVRGHTVAARSEATPGIRDRHDQEGATNVCLEAARGKDNGARGKDNGADFDRTPTQQVKAIQPGVEFPLRH